MKIRTDYYVTLEEVGDQALQGIIDITNAIHAELVIEEETDLGDTVVVGPMDLDQYETFRLYYNN